MKLWMRRALLSLVAISMVAVPLAWAATTYASNTCMPRPTPGDVSSQNTWGTLLNTATNIIDGITSASTSISVAGASNVVLTFTCGSVDQTDAAHFNFTGVLTGNVYVLWPNGRGRTFSVSNLTTGSFTLSLAVNDGSSGPAGASIAVPQGYTGAYVSDGLNVKSRVTAGGIFLTANSIPGNMTASAAGGTDLPVPTCSGGLTYSPGVGFGCNAGGGGGGGGGSGLAFGGVQTTSFAAAANTIYCVDTTGGTVTMTLPATPTIGNQIVFIDCASNFGTNALTVANNANLLMGFNQNMTVAVANAASTLVYASVANGWRMY